MIGVGLPWGGATHQNTDVGEQALFFPQPPCPVDINTPQTVVAFNGSHRAKSQILPIHLGGQSLVDTFK